MTLWHRPACGHNQPVTAETLTTVPHADTPPPGASNSRTRINTQLRRRLQKQCGTQTARNSEDAYKCLTGNQCSREDRKKRRRWRRDMG